MNKENIKTLEDALISMIRIHRPLIYKNALNAHCEKKLLPKNIISIYLHDRGFKANIQPYKTHPDEYYIRFIICKYIPNTPSYYRDIHINVDYEDLLNKLYTDFNCDHLIHYLNTKIIIEEKK